MTGRYIDTTFGAALIGVIAAGLLNNFNYGNMLTRTETTIRISSRTRYSYVAVVWVFETVHQALISHTVYYYVIANYDNADALENLVCLKSCLILQLQTWTELKQLRGLSMAVNLVGASADIVIAVALFMLLYRSHTGFKGSDAMISRLITLSVSTGMLTSLCAVASLVSILISGNTLIYAAFYFSLGRLYSNSLLACLNARQIIRRSGEISDAFSLHLQSASGSHPPNSTPMVRFALHHVSTTDAESFQEAKPGAD
ncbi:hypothetical protein CVT26_013242 [Gymnopilus dilepis]|uniref:DUF6534 domain-containing protein n=1 Tax=Gymnopilus dilepis TaxID=231916 RepID=A0A409WV69_9AGAR|nr:hypothetical protein CVT26_013242 [Gymnopilus dilepis]